MYTQQEKDGMAMKNATIDKFSKKDPCPKGMVDDGKGGCVSISNKLKAVAFGEAAKDKSKSEKAAPKGGPKGGPKEYAKSVINSMGLTDEEKKEALKKINK